MICLCDFYEQVLGFTIKKQAIVFFVEISVIENSSRCKFYAIQSAVRRKCTELEHECYSLGIVH